MHRPRYPPHPKGHFSTHSFSVRLTVTVLCICILVSPYSVHEFAPYWGGKGERIHNKPLPWVKGKIRRERRGGGHQ